MSRMATEAQINYIITLHNELHDEESSYLSQCWDLNLSRRESSGQLTAPVASQLIERLKRQIEKKKFAEETAEAVKTPATASGGRAPGGAVLVSMLGLQVEIFAAPVEGRMTSYVGRVVALEWAEDGLSLVILRESGRRRRVPVEHVRAWHKTS